MLCHFLKPELCLQSTDGTMAKPPSHTLKEAFRELNGRELSDEDIRRLSKSTLLPPDEVVVWIEHLQTIQNNRRRGAEKAAATRQQKKANEKHYFRICSEEYTDLTYEVQHWIGCDTCSCWFHCHCVGVPDSTPDTYLCSKCSK